MTQMKIKFSILLGLMILVGSISAQVLVDNQDDKMPLYTELSEETLSPYYKLFTKSEFSVEGMKEFRSFLKPYADKGDPIGMFMYAKAHDLYPFKKGSKTDAKIALEYFEKASNAGLADASYMLYGHYRNGYMTLPKDSYKSLEYMKKAMEQSNNSTKAALMTGLAKLHHSDEGEVGLNQDFPAVKYNTELAKYYLTEAIKLNPNNNAAQKHLASLNEK